MIGLLALAIALALSDEPDATVPTPPPPADCTIVDVKDANQIVGFPVDAPDEGSRSGGICFFISRNLSEDGQLTYAIVTPDRLPQRRAYFLAQARRCAPAVKGTLMELACRQIIALASAQDMDDYFKARTGAGDASAVDGFGYPAIVSGNALYIHRNDEVLELTVLISGDFDLDRTKQLATDVLAHSK